MKLIPTCYYCGVVKGPSPLKELKPGEDPPKEGVLDMVPCPGCEKLMADGILIIEVADGETDPVNPKRTGRRVVISEESAKQILDLKDVKNNRATYMEQQYFKLFYKVESKNEKDN